MMYSRSTFLLKYLRYYLGSANSKGHGTHSPFIFNFITKVLNDRAAYPAYPKVEQLRKELKQDPRIITIEDFGAGSSKNNTGKRSIKSIAKYAAKPKKYGQLLFRMVQFYHPGTILELGTSTGITTSYLALAQPTSSVTTMEGAIEIAGIAKQNFKRLDILNINIIEGNFDKTLPRFLQTSQVQDFVFIDGNHRKEPTLDYFRQIVKHAHNDMIIVFDDIHWSAEMELAWEEIKREPAVRCTVDLFFIGIVLFRKEFKERQHFTIRY